MEEHRFLISDAARLVAVEAHVLRYWEEELEIPIARTELGHRYYTRENIETFQMVKKLKEEGLQLKAIRLVLRGAKHPQAWQDGACAIQGATAGETGAAERTDTAQEATAEETGAAERTDTAQGTTAGETGAAEGTDAVRGAFTDGADAAEEADIAQQKMSTEETSLLAMRTNAEKLQQFRELVEEIVEKVVRDNNEELQRRLEESMAKETDYLIRMQEQREEERFRQLDEAIRARQKNSRYVAAAKERRSLWDKLRGMK